MVYLVFLLTIIVFFASIRKPLIGIMAMVAATQVELFFSGVLPEQLTLGRITGATAFLAWVINQSSNIRLFVLLKHNVLMASTLFVIIAFVSGMFAINKADAVSEAIRVGMLLLLTVMLVDQVNTKQTIRLFFLVVIIAGTIGALFAVMQFQAFGAGHQILGSVHESRGGVRYAGLHNNANALGINTLTYIVFAIYLLTADDASKLIKASMAVCVSIGLLTLALSVSRSTLFPLAVFLLVTYILRRKMRRPATVETLMIGGMIFIVVGAVTLAGHYASERLLRPFVAYEEETSMQQRFEIMSRASEVFNHNFLIGFGLRNSNDVLGYVDAHDTISVVVNETGLLGAALFLFIFVSVFRRQIRLLRSAQTSGDQFLVDLTIFLISIGCVLLVWIPVKVLIYQRMFWFWIALVIVLEVLVRRTLFCQPRYLGVLAVGRDRLLHQRR